MQLQTAHRRLFGNYCALKLAKGEDGSGGGGGRNAKGLQRADVEGDGNGKSYWRVIDSKDTFVEVVYALRIRNADYSYASLHGRTVVAVFTYLVS